MPQEIQRKRDDWVYSDVESGCRNGNPGWLPVQHDNRPGSQAACVFSAVGEENGEVPIDGRRERRPRTCLAKFLNWTEKSMKNLLIALSLAVLGATLIAGSAQAQRGGHASAPAGRGGAAMARDHGGRGGREGRGRGHGHNRGWGYGGYGPYFYSDLGYASDFGYEPDYEPMQETPTPQVVLGEPYQAATPPAPPKPAGGPELLELQDGQLVRIAPDGQPQTAGQSYRPEAQKTAARSARGRPTEAATPSSEAPNAILVFRDGHKEEIGKYCIMGATIRITTDYWSTGSWTRTVKISDLDVAATLKLNQERGTNFRLPTGPHEVMIGG